MSKVLVIEDEADIRRNILDLLEVEGFAASSAENGLHGLRVIRAGQIPDLILCDIMMPEMDGYGVLEELRKDLATSAIPFIFLTAKADRSDLRHGMELGADDFITKPFTRDELLKAISSRLMRAHAVRESTEAEFDQLKRRIGTMLAHELRTPLTTVMGYTDLALEDISTLSPEQLLNFLGQIKQGSARLARLVEDLLLLTQVDTGQIDQDFQANLNICRNLSDVIARTLELYQSSARALGLRFETEIDPQLPAVNLNQPLFATAFGHLLTNSIKFSKGQADLVKVVARSAGDGVDLAVIDHGIGIQADEIPRLFKRFHQINRQKIEQQGAGLGLAVARELIRMHGGDIYVESAPGSGSTFTIHLPALV
ncbi:MAG TPA: response regulator [Anaerolineae bacterium]|nr:response regulator [Anaerolineae bacterium]